jgi:hypothetical protein
MRVRKPSSVYTKAFIFRPSQPLHGKFSIGLSIEMPMAMGIGMGSPNGAPVIFEWCGSKRRLVFGPAMQGFVTNLRLPQNLTEGDVYVLSVSANATLLISVGVNGEEAAVESIALEEVDDGPPVPTVCADPTTLGDRSFEDQLATGNLVAPTPRPIVLGKIESLRPFEEGGILIFTFERPRKAVQDSNFMIHVTVGEFRKPCIMAPWQAATSVSFRLHPAAAGETWPLTLTANHAFHWSATIYRNFDTVFLPVFSLAE